MAHFLSHGGMVRCLLVVKSRMLRLDGSETLLYGIIEQVTKMLESNQYSKYTYVSRF